jgi:hypothetical protein
MWGPQTIAKLANIISISLGCMVDIPNYLIGVINQHSNHWGSTTLHYALHIPKLQPIKMQTHGEAAFNREVNYRFMGGIFKQQFKRGISEEQ